MDTINKVLKAIRDNGSIAIDITKIDTSNIVMALTCIKLCKRGILSKHCKGDTIHYTLSPRVIS